MVERWLTEFQRDMDEADPAFVRGYVRACAPRVGTSWGCSPR